MAQVIVSLKIMPDGADSDLRSIEKSATSMIEQFGGKVGKSEDVPIAFGLRALRLIFVMDESKGGTDKLEEQISTISGVMNVTVDDVRRALG